MWNVIAREWRERISPVRWAHLFILCQRLLFCCCFARKYFQFNVRLCNVSRECFQMWKIVTSNSCNNFSIKKMISCRRWFSSFPAFFSHFHCVHFFANLTLCCDFKIISLPEAIDLVNADESDAFVSSEKRFIFIDGKNRVEPKISHKTKEAKRRSFWQDETEEGKKTIFVTVFSLLRFPFARF